MDEFFSRVNQEALPDADVITPLEPVDSVNIERKLRQDYTPTPQGFQKLCADIATSHNPRTIQAVTHMLNSQFAEGYFRVPADQKLLELTGEIHTRSVMTGKRGRGIVDGHSALKEYTYRDPKLFLLLASEFYTQWCARHEQSPSADQLPGDDAMALFLEHHFRGRIDFSSYKNIPPELKERFTQAALDYFLHNAVFSSPSQAYPDAFAAVFNKLQPEQVVGRLLNRLGDGATVTAREKYNTTSLLTHLNLKPSKVSSRHSEMVGHVDIFGKKIDIDRSIEQRAYEIRLLSARGDIGVFDGQERLVGKFNWQDTQSAEQPVHVADIAVTDLFYQAAEANIPLADRERVLHEYTKRYWYYEKHEFFKQCQVPLRALAIKEQAAAIQLLLDPKATAVLASIAARTHGNVNTLRMCLLMYASTGSLDSITESTVHGREIKPALFQIYQPMPDDQRYPLETFADFVDQAEIAAQQLYQNLVGKYPDITLSVDDVTQGLITGALHTLGDVGTEMLPAENFRQALQEQINEITLGLTFFREIIGLAERNSIDLTQYRRRQAELLRFTEHNPAVHAMLVDILVKTKKLQPLPALFWTVDRPMSVYDKRSGIKIIPFFKALAATSTDREVFFEPGAGCGRSIAERSSQLSNYYADFALVDRVNYSIAEPLKKLIDIEKLAQALDIPDLTEADYSVFIDYIYKTIYLKPDLYQTIGEDSAVDLEPWHDREAIANITAEPNNLKDELKRIGHKLKDSIAVPADSGIQPQDNGQILYTKRVALQDQSDTVQKLINTFAADPEKFLRPKMMNDDLKKYVPIFPVGMMVGNFMDIKKFKPRQIKGSVDLRALVYLEAYGEDEPTPQSEQLTGPDYIEYFLAMADKLCDGAADVSDSVRENFAKSYRLRELYQLQQQLPKECHLFIVTGPDITGEDHDPISSIRSVILTKGTVERTFIAEYLESSEYRLYTLNEYLSEDNRETLLKLDANGTHYAQVKEMLAA